MTNDKIRMPSSTAGITQYFDDYHSKIKFKPGHIIIVIVILMIILLILQSYGTSIFGI